jgi:hypothetical protein
MNRRNWAQKGSVALFEGRATTLGRVRGWSSIIIPGYSEGPEERSVRIVSALFWTVLMYEYVR